MPRGKKKEDKKLQITYVRSAIGHPRRQKDTLRALGLRRLGQTVEHQDTPVMRGMIDRVRHLLQVAEVEA